MKAAENPLYASLSLANSPVIKGIQDKLKQSIPVEQIKEWTSPDQWHVTLVFAPDGADKAASVSGAMPSAFKSVPISSQRLGVFDNPTDGGRALHMAVMPNNKLKALQSQIYGTFAAQDMELSPFSKPEDWQPHITLAYLNPDAPTPDLDIQPCVVSPQAVTFTLGDYVEHASVPFTDSLAYNALKDFAPPAPQVATDEPDPAFATPEQYAKYWDKYDKLKDEFRRDWLSGYMKKVGPSVVDFYSKLGHQVQPEEVTALLSQHHDDLTAAWIGTEDAPGPLFAIVLAGFAAGNDTLETDKPAAPTATKSFGLIVDWNLLSAEALAFVKKYAFDLIKGIDLTTANDVRDVIQQGLEDGLSRDQIARQLNGIFNDPDRARLIAQTESIRAFNQGAFTRWSNAGVTKARWVTVNDGIEPNGHVCKICGRLNGQVANIQDGWIDPETGAVYTDMAHPGCRCFRSPEPD